MYKLTSDDFFNRCNVKYNYKFKYYDDYNGIKKNITINCPLHGDFTTLADRHLHGKDGGCLGCQKDKMKLLNKSLYSDFSNIFIDRSNKIHNNKYDYSKVNYIDYVTLVEIICPEHGSFFMSPTCHLRGEKCQICSRLTMGGYGGYNIKTAERNKDEWKNKSACVYVIEMYNDKERFIKIGITVQNDMIRRFSGYKYKIRVIDCISGNLYDSIYLERAYIDKYKEYKYIPSEKFKGHTECFNLKLLEAYEKI